MHHYRSTIRVGEFSPALICFAEEQIASYYLAYPEHKRREINLPPFLIPYSLEIFCNHVLQKFLPVDAGDNVPRSIMVGDVSRIFRQYVTYENPYFKVSVGNCTTQEEALVLLEDVKRYFPKAFIMRENIPLEELIIE